MLLQRTYRAFAVNPSHSHQSKDGTSINHGRQTLTSEAYAHATRHENDLTLMLLNMFDSPSSHARRFQCTLFLPTGVYAALSTWKK
jgi:hypothetical protein